MNPPLSPACVRPIISLPRNAARLLAVVLLTGFVGSTTAQVSLRKAGRVEFGALRSMAQSADGSEVVFNVDCHYTGFGVPPARLTAVVETDGRRDVARQFESTPVTVSLGRNVARLRVAVRDVTAIGPAPLVTDKVKIWAVNTWDKTPLGSASFARNITWNAREAGVAGERPVAPAEERRIVNPPPAERKVSPPPAPPEPPASSAVIEAIAPAPLSLRENAEADLATQAPEAASILAAVTTPAKRAAWQDRLTLGPGDVVTLSIFGHPELTKPEVFVGPDGRVSYLEAQDVLAAGLTIDELRKKLDDELANFRRAPSSIVTPVAFRSKKYFVLGKVAQRGVFTLDRPITVVEAVARARGLETNLRDRTLVEAADLSRSFLARQGKRVPVDFEKLFQAGDLSQNVPLEPDDYLYFPAGEAREVYVLGEVVLPGALAHGPSIGAVSAIASRGGFSERAWKSRILVVRGSLNRPQSFVVDAAAVLTGRAVDFKLEPKDIIYVSHRPWIKVEELLDAAASAFVQSVVVTWTGGNVGPFIK